MREPNSWSQLPTNNHKEFDAMPPALQKAVLDWIAENLISIGSINRKYPSDFYRSKCESDLEVIHPGKCTYVTKDEFNGALSRAGFIHTKLSGCGEGYNQWYVNVSSKSPIHTKN